MSFMGGIDAGSPTRVSHFLFLWDSLRISEKASVKRKRKYYAIISDKLGYGYKVDCGSADVVTANAVIKLQFICLNIS